MYANGNANLRNTAMIDFTPVRRNVLTMNEFAASLSLTDLRRLTDISVDHLLALLADADDAVVTFVPSEQEMDTASESPFPMMGWTIARIVVHMTATAEEYAVLAAELARGVPYHGPSRSEVPWQTVTTVAQCRARLLESRRIRLASLQLWPDSPRLDLGYEAWQGSGWVNAKGLFVWGLAQEEENAWQVRRMLTWRNQ
jgi:hypothetical protein